jgi:hypothetical protein
VGVDFVLLALLWISRDPKIIPGWGAAFKPGHVTDGTAARPGALVGRAWLRLLRLLGGGAWRLGVARHRERPTHWAPSRCHGLGCPG